jgi:hypothetical protein
MMYLLSYELRPSADNPEREGIGGAFVNSWIEAPSMEEARQRAQTHLTASGWVILNVEKEQTMPKERVAPDSMTHFQQAERDGEVFVIHAYPPEEPDA